MACLARFDVRIDPLLVLERKPQFLVFVVRAQRTWEATTRLRVARRGLRR
jgi:hypothetical protein